MAPDILESMENESSKDETNITRSRKITSNKISYENHSNSNNNQSTQHSKGNSNNISHINNGNGKIYDEFKAHIRWPDLIVQLAIHVGSLYGLYLLIALKAKFYTYIWCK